MTKGDNNSQISDSGSDSGWSFELKFSLRLRNGDYQNLKIVFVLLKFRNLEIGLYSTQELYLR